MRATSKIVPKKTYLCKGGPYDGERLRLITPSTLPFSCQGKKGRYIGAKQRLRTVDCGLTDYTYLNILDKKEPLYERDLLNPAFLLWEEIK